MADKYMLWKFDVRNPKTKATHSVEANAETQAEAIEKIQAANFLSKPSVEDFTLVEMIEMTIGFDVEYKTKTDGFSVQLSERDMRNLQFYGVFHHPNPEGGRDLYYKARWSINGICLGVMSAISSSQDKSNYDLVIAK